MSAEDFMRQVALFQYHHHLAIVLVALLFTGYMAVGAGKISMQGDIMKEMPTDLDPFKNEAKINGKFGGGSLLLIVVELEEGIDLANRPTDIRDPRIMEMFVKLQDSLVAEPTVDRVFSPGAYFANGVPKTLDGVKTVLATIPGADGLFNKDYSLTLAYVYTNAGTGESEGKALISMLEDTLAGVSKPPGVTTTITGEIPMIQMILRIMWEDAVYTVSLAALIILGLLIILQRSIRKGILVFIPLLFGLTWTLGYLGHAGRPLSVATVGVGAMILGLGVEYGIFLVQRYMEILEGGGSQKEAIITAVPAVGTAILGSGTTTIVGFLALTTSFMPMMQNLGITLAAGIASCLVAAVFINPAFIILEGRLRGLGDITNALNNK
ncbi:MAG: efflux RND transporter permease subunit [Candidatus Altiarchaeota archaeon]